MGRVMLIEYGTWAQIQGWAHDLNWNNLPIFRESASGFEREFISLSWLGAISRVRLGAVDGRIFCAVV